MVGLDGPRARWSHRGGIYRSLGHSFSARRGEQLHFFIGDQQLGLRCELHPTVVIEGAVRAPIVFDNGSDLVVAQIPIDIDSSSIAPTLEQIAGNLRGSGRGSRTVVVRLRGIESVGDGVGRPVVLGETVRDFQAASAE